MRGRRFPGRMRHVSLQHLSTDCEAVPAFAATPPSYVHSYRGSRWDFVGPGLGSSNLGKEIKIAKRNKLHGRKGRRLSQSPGNQTAGALLAGMEGESPT